MTSTPSPNSSADTSSFVIAIDGPAGAGKGTVARKLALRLGFTYIDTGAMYRCVALRSRELSVPVDDAEGLGRIAQSIKIEFHWSGGDQRVIMDGADVGENIRTNEISSLASKVSTIAGVRDAMVEQQRLMGRGTRVVMEGRDIGTVVFPQAAIKIFLTASLEERARRRAVDLTRAGAPVDLLQVRQELAERDQRDQERKLAPLAAAPGAVTLNTDGLGVDAVVDRIAALLPPSLKQPGAKYG